MYTFAYGSPSRSENDAIAGALNAASLLVDETGMDDLYPRIARSIAKLSATSRAPQHDVSRRQIEHPDSGVDLNELACAGFIGEKITMPHKSRRYQLSEPRDVKTVACYENGTGETLPSRFDWKNPLCRDPFVFCSCGVTGFYRPSS